MIIERALKEKKLINKEAIIDLGSNSIRMLIYDNLLNSQIPIFNEKAICELGKNLDKTGKLDPKGSDFALSVLQRFKRILSNLKVKKFKIIGTAAIREATDSKLFVAKVEKILKKKDIKLVENFYKTKRRASSAFYTALLCNLSAFKPCGYDAKMPVVTRLASTKPRHLGAHKMPLLAVHS